MALGVLDVRRLDPSLIFTWTSSRPISSAASISLIPSSSATLAMYSWAIANAASSPPVENASVILLWICGRSESSRSSSSSALRLSGLIPSDRSSSLAATDKSSMASSMSRTRPAASSGALPRSKIDASASWRMLICSNVPARSPRASLDPEDPGDLLGVRLLGRPLRLLVGVLLSLIRVGVLLLERR